MRNNFQSSKFQQERILLKFDLQMLQLNFKIVIEKNFANLRLLHILKKIIFDE